MPGESGNRAVGRRILITGGEASTRARTREMVTDLGWEASEEPPGDWPWDAELQLAGGGEGSEQGDAPRIRLGGEPPEDDALAWLAWPPDRDMLKVVVEARCRLHEAAQRAKQAEAGLTEQRALHQELRNARDTAEAGSRAKTAFLANMSHELRTPLNAVVGYAQLLQETDLPPLQRRYARTVADSGKLLMLLVADILDISKIEAGKVSLESVSFDLEDLVESAVRVEALKLERKPVEIVFNYPLDCPVWFEGDPVRVRQIVMNLLSNAGKFTAEGHIRVRVGCGGPCCTDASTPHRGDVRIEVEDTGIGIPEGKLDSIFEVFTQADSSTTRQYGGTGLGLAIVDRLVRLMGGRVEVTSRLGEGSKFAVEVPLRAASDRSSQHKVEEVARTLRGRSVVILSESHVLAAELDRFCSDAGMRVSKGMPGALSRVMASGSELVLIDLASERARESLASIASTAPAMAPGPRVLGVARTSASEHRGREGMLVASLQRPVTRKQLLQTLSNAVEESPASSEPDPAAQLATQAGVTVLVVEDNLVNQMLVRESLRKLGCSVDVASDGRRGLELARTRAYDLVLMDVQMPVMDGLEATRGIRAHVGEALPIIALTAGALKEDLERAMGAGMNDYLTKPIDLQTLRTKVARWARKTPGRGQART